MPVLVDTSALFALADADAAAHAEVRTWLEAEPEAIVVPQTLLCEVCYFVARERGHRAEAAFLASLAASDWRLEPLAAADLPRVVELTERYADLGLGFVDASIVAIAERLGVRRIHTLDRRHFALVRPRHVEAFELAP